MIHRYFAAAIFVLLCMVLVSGKSLAATVEGTGYFSLNHANIGNPAIDTNDVIKTSNRVAIPATIYDDKGDNKAEFMAWLDGYVKQGQKADTQNEIGAAFIVNTMLGLSAENRTKTVTQAMLNDVAARIAPSNIIITADSRDPNGIGSGKISFYDPGIKDDFYSDDWNPGARNILLFIDTSGPTNKIVYAIEIACANPVGQLTPPKPSGWDNKGISSVQATAYPGSVVNFAHKVTNVGPGNMDKALTINTRWTKRGANTANDKINDCNVRSPGLGNDDFIVCNNTATIPQDAKPGDLYCQAIYYAPNSNSDNATERSTPDCVRVLSWSISSTSSVSPSIAFINQPVTFSHSIKNNGPDSLNKPINGDIIRSSGFPPCVDAACMQYRFSSMDLPDGTASGYTSPLASRTYVFAAPGTYCENVRYNPENSNDFIAAAKDGASACVMVIDPASAVKAPNGRYEKGQGGTVTMVHELLLNLNAATCPVSAVTITWSVSGYKDNGTVYNNVPVISTVGAGNCANPSYTATVNGSWLDSQPISGIAYKTTAGGTVVSGSLSVYTVPYARFYGNDIYASGCGTDAKNGTIGFNTKYDDITTNTSGRYDRGKAPGSAVEYAAFALKLTDGTAKLNHISSGAYNSYPLYSGGLRLSSNFVAGKLVCPSTMLSNVQASLPDNSDITLDASNTYDVYSVNGGVRGYLDASTKDVTLTASGANTAANSAKQTIYANNVAIRNNIDLAPSSPFDPNTAPVLLIVAKGNVYIDKSVQTVSAIIVAGGTVYTCADAGTKTGYDAPNLDNNCSNPLEIKGSVSASEIKFGRTYGTRLCAVDYEASYSTCGTGVGRAAEVISFPAYMHFTSPYLKDTAGSTFPAIFNPAPYF